MAEREFTVEVHQEAEGEPMPQEEVVQDHHREQEELEEQEDCGLMEIITVEEAEGDRDNPVDPLEQWVLGE